MDKIGKRVKAKREYKKINLTTLAKKVGVTVSCLSQIEKGKAFPSIITLKLIANELDTTVGELIGENERLFNNPVMLKAERKLVKESSKGSQLYLLSHHDETKKMETFYLSLLENDDTAEIMKEHQGEEFLFVLEGDVSVTLDEKEHRLTTGDSAYYNSNSTHLVKNCASGISRLLWVVTPPNI